MIIECALGLFCVDSMAKALVVPKHCIEVSDCITCSAVRLLGLQDLGPIFLPLS